VARLYADEQYPYPVVEFLRALGHDVLTVQEAGRANQGIPDPDVLAFATSSNRAILTQNRKYFF
jgi:predicted nuclease of predicted toxin-antitoxin system